MNLKVDYLGMRLKTPFIIASGPLCGHGTNIHKIVGSIKDHWGAIVTKTYFQMPEIHLSPHLWSSKVIGDVGIQTCGPSLSNPTEEAMRMLGKSCRCAHDEGIFVIGSIMAISRDEWVNLAKMMEDAGCDAVELNLACPAKVININALHEGEADTPLPAQSPATSAALTRICKEKVSIPIIPKLTGQVTDILPVIRACKEAGADGFAAINTLQGILGVDVEAGMPIPRDIKNNAVVSGISGAMIRPTGLRIVSEICSSDAYLPTMGIGGIDSWESAVEYIMLGATAVQICTAFMMKGFKLGKQLCDGLTSFMERKGYNSIDEFRGIALKYITTFPTGFNGKAMVDERKCTGCGMCADACVTATIDGAIKLGGNKIAMVDRDVCIGCGLCSVVCKSGAVSVVEGVM